MRRIVSLPGQFLQKIKSEDMDSGFVIILSYPMNLNPSALSLHAATSVARWDRGDDAAYAYSTYMAARFSPLTIILISPFIEVSLAGPTYLSKASIGDIDFGSSVVYQNYIALGAKMGPFIVDIKMINYSTTLPTAFTKESKTLPLTISAGCSY